MTTPRSMTDKTIRCGVFHDIEPADRAVHGLLQAGFTREQISVLCTDKSKERHFAYVHDKDEQEPAGRHTPEAAAAGGLAGALFGGLVTLGITTAAGISVLAAGPSFLVGGAVAGGLIGAMQTRGEEGALADFYDQALTRGDLLVAVEDDQPGYEERLQAAEKILADAGARPVSLEAED